MGWGFTGIIALLAIPALLAGLAVLKARRAAEPATVDERPHLAHT
jgi:hypothetical protein